MLALYMVNVFNFLDETENTSCGFCYVSAFYLLTATVSCRNTIQTFDAEEVICFMLLLYNGVVKHNKNRPSVV